MSNLNLEERIKSFTPEQEKASMLLELHRLIRRGFLGCPE
jgi:hypothetical protein